MSISNERMLQAFVEYERSNVGRAPGDDATMATPPGTRLMRIIRLPHGWRVWTATRDFKFGSYLELFDDGRVLNCTCRVEDGDDYFWARPSDEELRRGS